MINLCDTSSCTGCGACINACKHDAIQMKENEEGFLYPIINHDKCVSCKLCVNSCPELNNKKNSYAIRKIYAGYANDNSIRERSSSGGVFSILADYVLHKGGIVVGAVLQDNFKLRHVVISDVNDIDKLRGSKYFQSNTEYTFSQIKLELKNKRIVLFCGTPCQVAGLKSFLNKSEIENLITCDFICHGVPSYLPLKKMVECSDKLKNYPTSRISFRNLRKWNIGIYLKKTLYRWEYLYPIKGKEEFYFKAYLKGYMSRECCYKCSYASPARVSDITIADFWNIEPKDDLTQNKMGKGISFIGVNSEQGANLLEKMKYKLFLQERAIEEIKQKNEQFNNPAYRPKERDTFYLSIKNKTWDEITIEYNYKPKGLSLIDTIKIYKNIIFSFKKSK